MSDLPPSQSAPRETTVMLSSTTMTAKASPTDLEKFQKAISTKLNTDNNNSQEAPEQVTHNNANNAVNPIVNSQFAGESTLRAYENLKEKQERDKKKEQEEEKKKEHEGEKQKKNKTETNTEGAVEDICNGIEVICKKVKKFSEQRMSRQRLRL